MTISFVSAVTRTLATANANYNFTAFPASIVAGDLLWVDFTTDGQTVATVPTGWTNEITITTHTGVKSFAYWRVYAAGMALPTFVLTGSNRVGGGMAAFRGTVGFGGGSVVRSKATATGTTGHPNPPSISSIVSGDWVLAAAGSDSTSATYTAPSGYTERIDAAAGQSDTLTHRTTAHGGGTEDPAAFTASVSTVAWTAYTAAIFESTAPVGGAPPPWEVFRRARNTLVRM